MNNNLYANINEEQNRAITRVKQSIQRYLIIVVLVFNILLEIISSLYTFGFRNPFTPEFFLELAVNTATTMICYACFIMVGQAEERKRTTMYSDNIKAWSKLSERVRDGYLSAFRDFCEEQVTEERNEAKRLILGNNTVISFEEYVEKYSLLNRKQLKGLYKEQRISKEEYKALNRANGFGTFNPTKIKPINPVIILSGVAKATINDAGRKESSFVARWLSTRPLLIFFSTALINAITTTFMGAGKNAILDIFLSVLMIVISSVVGYGAGQSAVKDKDDRVKSRIIFLSLFCQKNGVLGDKISKNPTEKSENTL